MKKDLRHGLPETVDALFYIPHKKEIALLSGNGAENRILGLVGILLLIHHNFVKPGGHGFGSLGSGKGAIRLRNT